MRPSPAPLRSRTRGAHGDWAKAGHDRALGSMAMAHQPLAAVFGLSVGMAAEEGCDLGLDGLRQQGSRTLAQNFGERVGEGFWLDQLDDIILGHGVSLLRWRSGGSNTPTIRRLNPSPPLRTSARSTTPTIRHLNPSRIYHFPRIPRERERELYTCISLSYIPAGSSNAPSPTHFVFGWLE